MSHPAVPREVASRWPAARVSVGTAVSISELDAPAVQADPARPAVADDPDALYADRADLAKARRAIELWRARLTADPTDVEAAWKIARAAYWLGGRGTPAERRAILESGLDAAFRFSQRLLESKHCFLTYLIGVAAQAQTTQAIRTAVWRPGMSAGAVRSLSKVLESEVKDAFAGHVRGEFANFFLPELAKNTGPRSRTLEDMGGSKDLADDVNRALEGHPQPFDRQATLREGAKLYLELIANLDRPRADRVDVVAAAGNQAAVWGEIVTSNAERIPSSSMGSLKDRLAKEKNPYGRLMLWIGLPSTVGDDDYRKANLDLTRIVVANRLYALGHGGRAAPKLADLGLKLTDPCSGKPYGYDARREIAWSVARNGKDEAGKNSAGSLRQSDPDWVVSLVGK